jgi:NAD(P)-dependent dehydrogenase (short-subunit alcohol dehydrogenase family)
MIKRLDRRHGQAATARALRARLCHWILALTCCVAAGAEAQTVLITGANSGLGLEFSKQYAEMGWTVIATHRRDTIPDTLAELSRLHDNVRVETMDVTVEAQVFDLAEKLRGQPIDVLINNAGIRCFCDWMDPTDSSQTFGSLRYDHFLPMMSANVMGVAMVTEAFIDHVKMSEQRKILMITSTYGTISDPSIARRGLWYGVTKAGVNKIAVTLAEILRADGVIVVPMHPGSVLVEKQADKDLPGMVETPAAIRRMIATIAGLDMTDSGKFLQYDGSPLPW